MEWNKSKGRLDYKGSFLKNPWWENIGVPFFSTIWFLKYLIKVILRNSWRKKNTDAFPARDLWNTNRYHSVFPSYYLTLFEFIIAMVLAFNLPLLLFHFLWYHNSKGKVSPPSRPHVLGEISPNFNSKCYYTNLFQ